MSALKSQLWEETKTARELRNQSSTLGTDQVFQEYENFANLVKKKTKTKQNLSFPRKIEEK